MPPLKLVMLCILIAVGIILFVLLLLYFIGNIYNGLVKRRLRVKSSWYEINKLFVKFFELVPEAIKTNGPKESQKSLHALFHQYHEIKDQNDVAKISSLYLEIVKQLCQDNEEKNITNEDSVTFISEYIRKINFSIPLYNDNVESYNHFRKLPVNIIMAKIFKFKPAIAIETTAKN